MDRDVREFIESFPFLRNYRFHAILTLLLAFAGLAAYVPIYKLLLLLTPVATGVFVGGGAGASFYTLREVEQWSTGDPLNWDKIRDALAPLAVWALATGIAQYLTTL